MKLIDDKTIANKKYANSHKNSWIIRPENYLIFPDGLVLNRELEEDSTLDLPHFKGDDDDKNKDSDYNEISALFKKGSYLYIFYKNRLLRYTLVIFYTSSFFHFCFFIFLYPLL